MTICNLHLQITDPGCFIKAPFHFLHFLQFFPFLLLQKAYFVYRAEKLKVKICFRIVAYPPSSASVGGFSGNQYAYYAVSLLTSRHWESSETKKKLGQKQLELIFTCIAFWRVTYRLLILCFNPWSLHHCSTACWMWWGGGGGVIMPQCKASWPHPICCLCSLSGSGWGLKHGLTTYIYLPPMSNINLDSLLEMKL